MFGFGLSKSDNEAEQAANFNQNVWGGQAPALQGLYGQMGELFGQTTGGMQALQPGATQQMQDVYQQTQQPWQQQMQGGTYQGMDLQGKFADTLGQPSAMSELNNQIMGGQGNDYADAMRTQMQSDAFDTLGRQYANIDQRAANSGMGGSSRHGILQSQAFQDVNKQLGENLTNVGYQTFDRNLDRNLGIAQQADMNRMTEQGNLGNMLAQQNQAIAGGMDFGQGMQNLGMGQFAPSMAPWQAATPYASALGRPTVLGSGTSSGSSEGSAFGMNAQGGGKK